MSESSVKKECFVCKKGENEIPLVKLEYQGGELRICPQDLPTLIHSPADLTGKLPGAEDFGPADTHD